MRISLATRAAGICAGAIVVFSLSLAPSYARMGRLGGGSFASPTPESAHFQHFAPRGFDRRFDFNRFGFSRFGPNRFNRFGFNRFRCFNCFDRFGSNRFGFNRFGNQLFGWGWAGWGGFPVSTAASEPIVVGSGAPVIINVGADPPAGQAGAGSAGACVTHKLIYDGQGKYVGERQTSQC
jgi:hypothetical protein